MEIKDLFVSTIVGKKILLIQPGNTLQTTNFTGLNFEETTRFESVNTTDDFKRLRFKHYDYIIIHGFLARDLESRYDLYQIQNLNISCNDFVIDYLGEGYSIDTDIPNILKSAFTAFKIENIKIIHPLESKNTLNYHYAYVHDYSVHMAGPKVFCSPYNFMFHSVDENNFDSKVFKDSTYVYAGTKWSSEKKDYLFMCLNNRRQDHRISMVNSLSKNELLDKGIVSCRFGKSTPIIYYTYDNGIVSNKINLEQIIPKEDLSGRFGPNIHFSKNSYIDVVTENAYENKMFITEKSMKPFFNLQIPIILGPFGITNVLREYGFDLFDDIVNHEYDNFKFELSMDEYYNAKLNTIIDKKTDFISKELKRLSQLNIHDIYLSIQDRLIKNQELANKICIDDNELLEKVGKWVFGDSFSFTKVNKFNKVFL